MSIQPHGLISKVSKVFIKTPVNIVIYKPHYICNYSHIKRKISGIYEHSHQKMEVLKQRMICVKYIFGRHNVDASKYLANKC